MPAKRFAFILGVLIALFAVFHFTSGGGVSSPQQFTMRAGSSSKVGGGKALMWFAVPTEVFANNRIHDAAVVALTCDGRENTVTILRGQTSPTTCGLRVTVLDIREPDKSSKVFRGTFKVEWP